MGIYMIIIQIRIAVNTFPLFVKRSCITSIQRVSKLFFLVFQKTSSFFMHVIFVAKHLFQSRVQIVVPCSLVFIVGAGFIISDVIHRFPIFRENYRMSFGIENINLLGFEYL